MGSDILLLVSNCDQDAVSLQAAVGDGYALLVAADAVQALQLMHHAPCLVIISDRISESASLCSDLRQLPGGAFVSIVLLNDSGSTLDAADADGALSRPLNSAGIVAWLQAVQRLMRLRQSVICDAGGKKNCEQLLQSFARLSHAVNNPLQALYATVDMLLLNHALAPEAAALTSEIISHAGRVAKLVSEASGEAKLALQTATPQRPSQVS